MRNYLIIIGLFFLSLINAAQDHERFSTADVRIKTSDELIWEGQRYNMSETPLASFPKYRSIYYKIPGINVEDSTWITDDKYPVAPDKKYSVIWKVVDSMLYVSDLYFFTLEDPSKDLELFWVVDINDRFRTIEKLTGQQFDKSNMAASVKPESPYGVLPAYWYTGDIFIKKKLTDKKNEYNAWQNYPVARLSFMSGKLIDIHGFE